MGKIRAIVVDDEESVLEAVHAILDTEGIEVHTTKSCLDAVDMIRRNRYDLIISDIRMPDMDGICLLGRVRELSPESIFIVITAYATKESEEQVLDMGADDYIPKPFTPNEVRGPVKRALRKKGLTENIADSEKWSYG